jgi:hypothetical protein
MTPTTARPGDDRPAPAPTDDYTPPGAGRVVPPVSDHERLFGAGRATHPHNAFIRCGACGHAAWRDAPGVDSWTCGCPPKCDGHHPVQVLIDGAITLAWPPSVVTRLVPGPTPARPFPGPPTEAA